MTKVEDEQLGAFDGTYSAKDMSVLEGLEPVRKRPGMFIGSTGSSGLHHLVWEVVDNSVDEAMAGYCTRIDVTLLADGGCRVVDNGRGIPTDMNPQYKLSGVEIALTRLHGGGKFGGVGLQGFRWPSRRWRLGGQRVVAPAHRRSRPRWPAAPDGVRQWRQAAWQTGSPRPVPAQQARHFGHILAGSHRSSKKWCSLREPCSSASRYTPF